MDEMGDVSKEVGWMGKRCPGTELSSPSTLGDRETYFQ